MLKYFIHQILLIHFFLGSTAAAAFLAAGLTLEPALMLSPDPNCPLPSTLAVGRKELVTELSTEHSLS